MNKRQIKWARSHDWYVAEKDHGVIVCEIIITAQNEIKTKYEYFDDYRLLRQWAGY